MIRDRDSSVVAYFSMEVGLESSLPTYSGGLGVLAGDTLRAAADLGLPLVAITLVHHKGYFRQHLDARGNQSETDVQWSPEQHFEPLDPRCEVEIEGRRVRIRAWHYTVRGIEGHEVPVYLLDTDVPENSAADRRLTDHLYGGDDHYRLAQEALLGLGGIAMLRALGYDNVHTYHMNEGHSALLVLALLEERQRGRNGSLTEGDPDVVRQHCVFTTHTPISAGHDQFGLDLARQVLGERRVTLLQSIGVAPHGSLNMTHIALRFARYVNAVAMRHGHVSRVMFPDYTIWAITNGVHATTWTAEPFHELFDTYIPEWRHDNLNLRQAIGIPLKEVEHAHREAKGALMSAVEQRTGRRLERDRMTLGFGRRAATYKRPDLLFTDLARLRRIAREVGPLQVVYAGKAHPHDEGGKALIRNVFDAAAALGEEIPVVYLEEYDMDTGRTLTAGVDLWLNNPERPYEASGTSGMKAALNGVPSLSVLDGWWIEGHVEGVTGWSIGTTWDPDPDPTADSRALYEQLESVIVPMYYRCPEDYAKVQRGAITLNGSFFNAQRMMLQYARDAYRL